jgi:hypothetical protein
LRQAAGLPSLNCAYGLPLSARYTPLVHRRRPMTCHEQIRRTIVQFNGVPVCSTRPSCITTMVSAIVIART